MRLLPLISKSVLAPVILTCPWINSNDGILEALLALYERQTPDEKALRKTMSRNGRGFNAADACVLTELAEKVIGNESLSKTELENVMKRLAKYHRQLLEPELFVRDVA